MRKLWIVLMLLAVTSPVFAFTNSENLSSPADGDNLSEGAQRIREFKVNVYERLDVDHEFGDTNAELNDLTTGYHRKVSMIELSTPATISDGIVVYSKADGADSELAVVDSNGNDVQITKDGALNLSINPFTATNLSVTNNLSAGGTAIITGATTLQSTLDVTGATTITGHLTAGDQLGAWASKSDNTTYQAATDGFFVGVITAGSSASAGNIIAYTDSSTPPTTERSAATVHVNTGASSQTSAHNKDGFCVVVKKDDYYKGTLTSAGNACSASYYWIPLD